MKQRLLWILPHLAVVILFAVALAALHQLLREYTYHDIVRELQQIPGGRIALALALTAVNYVAMSGYDVLSLRYIRHPLEYRRTALASFIGYAFSQIGFPLLVGGAARYRVYSTWGISGAEVARVTLFNGVTLWSGVLLLTGCGFLFGPQSVISTFPLPETMTRILGAVFLTVSLGYVLWCLSPSRRVRFRNWELSLPAPRLAVAQILVSAVDWALAASVLFVLMPDSGTIPFGRFLLVYLMAQATGLISHVPGGLGIFEGIILVLIPGVPHPALLGSLLVYRGVYYLFPMVAATATLLVYELQQRREGMKRLATVLGQWAPIVAPSLLSFITFMAGIVLLVSGATPAIPRRLLWIKEFLPLPIVEISHFLGSVIGMALVLLARGVQRRVDAAYHFGLLLLGAGIVMSMLKGFDYEEAAILTLILIAFVPCHKHFYRKASLFTGLLSPQWLVTVVIVILGTLWLGLFSYKHIEYSHELWWQFEATADAPRFLRATVGATTVALLFGFAQLLRPGRVEPKPPEASELDAVRAVIAASCHTSANLALMRDKALLVSDSDKGFVMYDVAGRSWVAMGDPVGAAQEQRELAWRFRELCDQHDGWPVFYEVGLECLPIYLEMGLALYKIGEEARISLEKFTLEGKQGGKFRYVINRMNKDGCAFEIAPQQSVDSILAGLRKISDSWLAAKNTREKRFSLGFFDEDYLRNFPIALVRKDKDIVAFANVWITKQKEELSTDLMRYSADAPGNVMEYLFTELALWGKTQGYSRFNLGMAPLSGLADHSLASVWNRIGTMIFTHGEHFYNFQGLRQYKEKFNPEWEPRYLAAPGILSLPRILISIASLVSGGLKGVVTK